MAKYKERYRIESTRLPGWNYAQSGWYFVTLCTKNHIPFFGHVLGSDMVLSPIGEIVAEEWQRTPDIRANVTLDEWVIMPNHLHGILAIVEPTQPVETPRQEDAPAGRLYNREMSTVVPARLQSGSLGAMVGQIKSVCTKRIRAAGHTDFGWQPRFHDHIIRNRQSLHTIREYIANNPAKWADDRYYVAGDGPAGRLYRPGGRVLPPRVGG